MKTLPIAAVGALALAAASQAGAHVVLSQPHAPAGAHYTGYFRVTHGCDGAATTALRIEIPADVEGVKPQPKPGWTLSIEHEPAPGAKPAQRVSAITWTGGPLPDDQWDEFGLSAKLPAHAGFVVFPSVQACGQSQVRWSDPATPGHASTHPAPTIMLDPARPDDGMMGMSMKP